MKLIILPLKWAEFIARLLIKGLIQLYIKAKYYLPFLPRGTCRFYPTCSSYALTSIDKYPLPKAIYKIVWRVLRCNPFNPGGYDPPL